ncbi:MAG: signal peptide peptidase SppA [Alphaproteobacteria bacterium]|nr:signal peptide peptidase SppA [Alphaproteobacteria bacterium]
MSFDVDAIVDRRRLKRRLALWRLVAIVAALAVVAIGIGLFGGVPAEDHVAHLRIDGLILDDRERLAAVNAVAEDASAKALVVHVNSPGGTTVGAEALYEAVRRVAEAKPAVAVIGTVGASGGYLVALATDHIVSRSSSLTGSIGVILQTAEFTELLADLGVSAQAIKSAPLKGAPSPLEPLSPEARAATQAVVDDVYAWFVDILADRRGYSRGEAVALADGRVFTGRQALTARLVDELGGEAAARAWLSSARAIPIDLPDREVEIEDGADTLWHRLFAGAKKAFLSERLILDALASVWHPPAISN